jgi:hypothetical protein
MRSVKRTTTTAASITTALVVAATSATATAAPAPRSGDSASGERVLASGVGAPFQIARRGRTVFYTDGFVGTINKITRNGPKVVARVTDVSGVEFSRNRKTMAIASGGGPGSKVTLVSRHRRPIVARVGQYEENVNPDRGVTYGILANGSTCAADWLSNAMHTPAGTYPGTQDSHPYQVVGLRRGAFAVAEAGGNGILRVGRKGRISTIALLPRQPITFTRAQVDALEAPDCVVGVRYAFEPVPTDVERGPRGSLLVSTLPGGPESPVLGARGSVYRISRRGVVSLVATGFLGATNVAAVRGRVYVSELFAGRITKFGRGGRFTRYNIPGAVSVEATRKRLYVGALGAGPTNPGKVIRLPR